MKRQQLRLLAAIMFVVYVQSYLIFSRAGHAEADRYQSAGFFYVTPELTFSWRLKNTLCVFVFWPANCVDRLIGFGRDACYYEPLFELSTLDIHFQGILNWQTQFQPC